MKTKPEYQPTEEGRRMVMAMSGYGIPHVEIALVVGIAPKTLRKHFRHELDTGHINANAKVAESLYNKAIGDGSSAVTAAIWWTKAQMGWREKVEHEHGITDTLAEVLQAIDGASRGLPQATSEPAKTNGANGSIH